MKFILCLNLLVLLVLLVQAQTAIEEPLEQQDSPIENQDMLEVEVATAASELHPRQKRATCDLLSFWNVNHTACAAHCIAKRFRGGHCNGKAVCVCRH